MKIAFYTLGCKVNQYETQALKEAFQSRGYEVVGEHEPSDIYVVNTCTVTGLSDRKSRQYIRRVRRENPDCITCVIGCYAQVSPEEAIAIEGVNIVAGTNEKQKLPEYVEAYLLQREARQDLRKSGEIEENERVLPVCHIKDYDNLTQYEETGVITSMESRTRAFIKIQEGCNQFCSYCIIPYARGSVRSRSIEDITAEAENLVRQGFKELVLTGINTALYGREPGFFVNSAKDCEMELMDDVPYGIEAVVRAVSKIPGEFRIRLGSLEPTVVNADYVERLMKYDRLCPHMHLSLQSGSSRVLAAMNRHYDREEYLKIVEVLRRKDPGYGISADVIVGFPGESEADFEDSKHLVLEAGLCRTHVFPYSRRKGTPAAEMDGQIAPQVKKERSRRLAAAAEESAKAFFRGLAGTVREVLVEEYDEETGWLRGYADNYVRVYCRLKNGEAAASVLNQFCSMRLEEPFEDGMTGIPVEESVR